MALFPVKIPRTSKPPLGTPIDQSNPLAQNLAIIFNGSEGGGSKLYSSDPTKTGTITGTAWNKSGDLSFLQNRVDFAQFPVVKLGDKFTVFSKVRCLTTPNIATRTLVSHDGTTGGFVLGPIFQSPNNPLRFSVTNTSGTAVTAIGTTLFEAGKTYDLCGVFDNPSVKIYVNGKLEKEEVGFTGTPKDAVVYLGFDGFTDSANFIHYYSAIFNKVFKLSEITNFIGNPWQIFEPETIWVEVADAESPAGLGIYVNIGGTVKQVTAAYALIGGVVKQISMAYGLVGGVVYPFDLK